MRPQYVSALLFGLGLTAFVLSLIFGEGTLVASLIAAGSAIVGGIAATAIQRSLERDAKVLAAAAQGDAQSFPENPAFEALATTLAHSTQRQLAGSRALSDEARTLAAVLDGMEEGLWITDKAGMVVRHNSALRAMLPDTPIDGALPLGILRSIELHDAVRAACAFGKATRLELTVGDRQLAVTVSPVEGEPGGSAAVFHDQTELRRLEKVRKDFVANVSHELRTPITAVRGYAETLQGGALADPAQAGRMVEIIHRQALRLSELVDDLLELSRLEAKETVLRREPVALRDPIQRAVETVRPKAAARGVTVEPHLPAELVAEADAAAVETVALNLIDNAVKYTASGGKVEVRGEARDGRCVMVVADSGIGIEAKHLSRLFERFYRVDKGRSRDQGGTGLGLSIVKHLVGGMGGEVKVESQPGVGTTFTVALPLHRDSEFTG